MRKLTVRVTQVREAQVEVSDEVYEALARRKPGWDAALRSILDSYPDKLGDPEWVDTTITNEDDEELIGIG